MRDLYHYCCGHSLTSIRLDGWLQPHPHHLLCESVVWLTDLEQPHRDALGLTSHTLRCDRTEYRLTVHTGDAVWWPTYARRLDMGVRRQFEFTFGAMPAHWWVSTRPLKVASYQAVKGRIFR